MEKAPGSLPGLFSIRKAAAYGIPLQDSTLISCFNSRCGQVAPAAPTLTARWPLLLRYCANFVLCVSRLNPRSRRLHSAVPNWPKPVVVRALPAPEMGRLSSPTHSTFQFTLPCRQACDTPNNADALDKPYQHFCSAVKRYFKLFLRVN